jgi:hypothetical protein
MVFYPFDVKKYDNIGASSRFIIDFTKRSPTDADYGKKDVQLNITVPSTRLDTFCEQNNIKCDMLCCDLQEGELLAFKGMGDRISDVKFIITEFSYVSTYKGGCNFDEICDYLRKYGFECIEIDFPRPNHNYFSHGNALFVNYSYNDE